MGANKISAKNHGRDIRGHSIGAEGEDYTESGSCSCRDRRHVWRLRTSLLSHYRIAAIRNKTTLARHRLVNTALKAEVAAIHAWTPKCYTPEQWEKMKADGNAEAAPGKETNGEVVNGTTA